MSNYLMLVVATVLLALGFVLEKIYQRREGASFEDCIRKGVYGGVFTAIIFFFISGMKFEMTSFSLCMSLLTTVFSVSYTIIGYRIIKDGQVALYTFFLMTGGMIVPYIFGVLFLGEKISLIRTIGLIVITLSVFITKSSDVQKSGIKSILMCIAVFFLNGFVSVSSKIHQINPAAIPSESFVMMSGIINFVSSAVMLEALSMMKRKKSGNAQKGTKKRISPFSMFLIVIGAVMSGASYLLQLKGAISLPATVLYPIITGGSIVFTAIAGWICLGEKPDKKLAIGMIMCFIGTCMFI